MSTQNIQMGLTFDADLAPIVNANSGRLDLINFIVGVQTLRLLQKQFPADVATVVPPAVTTTITATTAKPTT